jgi:ornithine carbamoyltransferase
LNGKDLLSVADLDAEDIRRLISSAVALKAEGWSSQLNEKTLILVFEKPSLRTRVSFELAMRQLGGQSLYLSPEEVGLGKRESVPDAARVLSRFADVVAARTFAHATVTTLAANAAVPVINALSDREHPCQALADLLTIYERKPALEGLNVAYIGDGNNCANSLLLASALTGMNFCIAAPKGYEVPEDVLQTAEELAGASGSRIAGTEDPRQAAEGADVIYTDVWVSMGQEAEAEQRRRTFAPYQVTEELLALANANAILMHPLPAHHGEEVAANIIYSPQSVVFDQAENRLHAQKALLAEMLGGLEIPLANYQ